MKLTNYVLQSVAEVFLFNGLNIGLLGQIDPSIVLSIITLFLIFQKIFSSF
ncbi:MAG: DUF418 domain-containing protein [Tunicatimonas sp.]|uniref:DUF418 domain-containing protein n=1 Tax=Tunicatimonas sp. TaxID=1940096 RepID=UPI003C76475E